MSISRAYLFQNRLTLSAFHALIKQYDFDNPLVVSDHTGTLWNLYYVPLSRETLTEIKVKENSVYTVSGNNRDGFVVASHVKN